MKKEKEATPENIKLLEIEKKYLVDLECLREMHCNVIPLLNEKDIERKKLLNETIKRLFTNRNQLKGRTDEKISGEQDKSEEPEEKTSKSETNTDEEINKNDKDPIKLTGRDAEFLTSTIGKLKRAQNLFENQAIVTLVSRFDEFLGEIIKLVLGQNPSWLKSSEKTITYKELIDLKSIDKAIEGVIHKEVENLLRDSHEEQINYVDEKLKLGIEQKFEKYSEFLEIAERRNLFVHTGGVVSQQYIDKCNSFGADIKKTKQGDCLSSHTEYFTNAFMVYFEIALRISQASYRRLFPNELESADRALNNLAIRFMNEGEYILAEIITTFDLAIPDKLRSQDTEYLYFAYINQAISRKYLNKDFEKGLNGIHWNVFHPKYALCLHALREEYEEASNLMYSKEIQNEITQEGFRTWPAFRDFRDSHQFNKAYKDIYGIECVPNTNVFISENDDDNETDDKEKSS